MNTEQEIRDPADKSSCVLEQLKYRWHLNPKDFTITPSFRYECKEKCGLLDNEFDSILQSFQDKKFIKLSSEGNITQLAFSKDFEQLYKEYKANIANNGLGVTEDNVTLRFPHKLPAGTVWEDFIVKFIDNENVEISVLGKNYKKNFIEMGFDDKRNSKPNSQWQLLKILANNKCEINWKSSDATEKIKKIKERLAKNLQNYFRIEYDPFQPYKQIKAYRIKLTLIPPINEGHNKIQESLDEEIQQMFANSIVNDQ